MRFFFDTETSGLPEFKLPSDDPFQPFLAEFAGVLMDDELQTRAEFQMIVAPPNGREIPSNVSAIHGITTEIARRSGVSIRLPVSIFLQMIRITGGHLVAHNIKFDLRIMKIAMFQAGMKREAIELEMAKIKPYCTMSVATKVVNLPPTPKMIAAGFNKPKSPSLAECYKHFFGEDLLEAHSAMADVKGCINVFRALSREAMPA